MRARKIWSEDILLGVKLDEILADKRELKKTYQGCDGLYVTAECYSGENEEPRKIIVELVPFEDTGEYRLLTTDKIITHLQAAYKVVIGDNIIVINTVYALRNFPHLVVASIEATKNKGEL